MCLHGVTRTYNEAHFLDSLNIAAVAGSTTAVKQAVRAGLGISLISARAFAEDVRLGLFLSPKIQGAEFKRHFYIAMTGIRPRPSARHLLSFSF